MVHLKSNADEDYSVSARLKVINPAYLERVYVTFESFIYVRPKDVALEIMRNIVLFMPATKNAIKMNWLMHSVAGAPSISHCLQPSQRIMTSGCFCTCERTVNISSRYDKLL